MDNLQEKIREILKVLVQYPYPDKPIVLNQAIIELTALFESYISELKRENEINGRMAEVGRVYQGGYIDEATLNLRIAVLKSQLKELKNG